MYVEAADTINTTKALIKIKEGIPRKHQRLLYGDTELTDFLTLDDYNISAGSVLLMAIFCCCHFAIFSLR